MNSSHSWLCRNVQTLWACLVHVFKNWKLLFENICKNTCGWKSTLKCINCYLKTENNCLKIQTKHPLALNFENTSGGFQFWATVFKVIIPLSLPLSFSLPLSPISLSSVSVCLCLSLYVSFTHTVELSVMAVEHHPKCCCGVGSGYQNLTPASLCLSILLLPLSVCLLFLPLCVCVGSQFRTETGLW